MIEITNVSSGGKLSARYYNPNPIRVEQAKYVREDGRLTVFVKLNDRGYRGSTYALSYDPKDDVLVGIYYQASSGQQYEVGFLRMPKK